MAECGGWRLRPGPRGSAGLSGGPERADHGARLPHGRLTAELVEAVLPAQAEMLDHPEPVNDEVARRTGTPARSFGEWAVDHAADFR